MHRLVPEFILEQDQAQHSFGEFAAVGMFLDISGFSAMTDSLMRHGQHGAEVLARAHYVTRNPAGACAVRECCDLLLCAVGSYATLLDAAWD